MLINYSHRKKKFNSALTTKEIYFVSRGTSVVHPRLKFARQNWVMWHVRFELPLFRYFTLRVFQITLLVMIDWIQLPNRPNSFSIFNEPFRLWYVSCVSLLCLFVCSFSVRLTRRNVWWLIWSSSSLISIRPSILFLFLISNSSRFVWFFSSLAQAVNESIAFHTTQKRESWNTKIGFYSWEKRFRHLLKSISFGCAASNYLFWDFHPRKRKNVTNIFFYRFQPFIS